VGKNPRKETKYRPAGEVHQGLDQKGRSEAQLTSARTWFSKSPITPFGSVHVL